MKGIQMTKPRYKWQPLIRANVLKPPAKELVELTMKSYNISEKAALQLIEEYQLEVTMWINDIYQVQRREFAKNLIHLNIRRRDGGPILRDWRHFQQIKNELIGEECEAVELYPAESRLVDTSNKFHLWGIVDPNYRFPLGFDERDVQYGDSKIPGMRQRTR
jgi:hypothetical protein